ncbi:MAG: hypothetical protein JXR51_04815 [Bacteroidales bacterium]|nr:hypothetical protein [Bacteroidales bacterium]MBN2756480.1 hypothetical protein [Bacteroidales bacterium]
MKNILIYFARFLFFAILGFLSYQFFMQISVNQLIARKIETVFLKLSGQFEQRFMFALIIGIIPVLYLIVKKSTKIKSNFQMLFVYLNIIIFGIIFWQFRIYSVIYIASDCINTTLVISRLNLNFWIFIGLIIGTITSIFILIFINKNKT